MTEEEEKIILNEIRPAGLIDPIVERISEKTGISVQTIRSKDRRAPIYTARALAMSQARDLGLSLSAIGRYFERDHTTVISACRRIKKLSKE
jgi:chromosomal replication initiator protein